MDLREFQQTIRRTYHERDAGRGIGKTFMWFTEEVGELAQAIRKGDRAAQEHELADALAWLTTVANLCEIDLSEAAKRYAAGCPRCRAIPCACPLQ